MKISQLVVFCALFLAQGLLGQTPPPDHLTAEEVSRATKQKEGFGTAEIKDQNMFTFSYCKAQVPTEFLYTPEGWVNVRSYISRKAYKSFEASPEDTARVFRVISQGCATGTPAGPSCTSLTRVVLLSDVAGTVVIEALETTSAATTWQNGFGASTACNNLVSKFSMAELQKVANSKGEFLIATFSGSTLVKTYTVKERFLKQLGLQK